MQKNFAGINLEDISSPKCYEVENRLKEEFDKKLNGKGVIIYQKVLKKEENNSTIKYRVFIITNELINAYSYFEDSDINDTNQSN